VPSSPGSAGAPSSAVQRRGGALVCGGVRPRIDAFLQAASVVDEDDLDGEIPSASEATAADEEEPIAEEGGEEEEAEPDE